MASELLIRAAGPDDAERIVELIRALARFEKLEDQLRVTPDDLRREGWGEGGAHFECLLAERDGAAVGFALFFRNFSTFEGKSGIYLEDLYVREELRGQGIGKALLKKLAAVAVERGCPRLELSVLHWNPARSFYETLGFAQLSEWRPYRLSGEALRTLATDEEP